MAAFDVDALWGLYDDSDATRRGHVVPDAEADAGDAGSYDTTGTPSPCAPSPSPSSPSSPRSDDVESHDGTVMKTRSDELEHDGTVMKTVTISPGLVLPLHVPQSLLEDGCLGEVGGMVWDCAVVLARYLLSASASASASASVSGSASDDSDDGNFHVDLLAYDHIVELGSGLGLLGFALNRYLCVHGNGSFSSSTKVTLTDYVPELVHAMRRTAADETSSYCSMGQSGGGGSGTGGSSGASTRSSGIDAMASASSASSASQAHPSLGVSLLDWSDPSGEALARCRIQAGESVLIVASEVLYEPCHADMLARCIDTILARSECRDRCRVLVANFAERPGWRRFVDGTAMGRQAHVEATGDDSDENGSTYPSRSGLSSAAPKATRCQVREMDLGSGGYELLDIKG